MPRTARTALSALSALSARPARRLPALAAVAALGLGALTGCASVEEKTVEAAIKKENPDVKDVDVDKDGGFEIEGEDGTISAGSKAKLPDGFPDDVPLPRGGSITTAVTQGDEMVVMWTLTKVDVDAERSRLTSELAENGYAVGDESTTDLGGLASFSLTGTGHGRVVTVLLTQPDGEDAQVMYNVKPEA